MSWIDRGLSAPCGETSPCISTEAASRRSLADGRWFGAAAWIRAYALCVSRDCAHGCGRRYPQSHAGRRSGRSILRPSSDKALIGPCRPGHPTLDEGRGIRPGDTARARGQMSSRRASSTHALLSCVWCPPFQVRLTSSSAVCCPRAGVGRVRSRGVAPVYPSVLFFPAEWA